MPALRAGSASSQGSALSDERLAFFDAAAVLFDLDGVLTPTAEVHMRAWRDLFTDYLTLRGETGRPYVQSDYFDFIDGKPRYDGVRDFLASRDITLPEGDPSDATDAETVCGLGNRKNDFFSAALAAGGGRRVPRLGRAARPPRGGGHRRSPSCRRSRNAPAVLDAAGLADRFDVVVDGRSRPQARAAGQAGTGHFLAAARTPRCRARPQRGRVEDAVSGVRAGRAGGFGLVVGVDRGVGADKLTESGADLVVTDLAELVGPARS